MRDIERYTEEYMVENFEDYQVEYRRRKVLEQIEKYGSKHILEIGCGMEPLFQLTENIDYTIVEPSEVFYEHAVKLSSDKDSNIRCIRGLFEEGEILEKLHNDYDMIVCSALLHEVEKPEALIRAIKKICNRETVIHINVPNANSLHRLLAMESGMINDIHEKSRRNIQYQQHNVFDMDSLEKIAEGEGLQVLDKGSYFVKPFTHSQMFEIIKNDIIGRNILDGLYRCEKYMPGLGSEIFINCKI